MRLERESEFWEIDLDDRSYVMRSGRLGTRGQSHRVTCATADEAIDAHDRQIVTMLKVGWREPSTGVLPLAGLDVRDAALEQAILDHKDDRDTYAVYADWLQAAGNPIGELIALAVRLDLERDAKVDKRIAGLLAALRLPLPDQATFRFRWGVWRTLRLENMHDERDGPSTAFRLSAFARVLFGHVLCCALDELAIGALQWRHNYTLVPQVLEEAERHAWARGLRTLDIGEVRSDPDPAYYASDYDAGKLGPLITRAFPNLTSLRVHAGFKQSKFASSLEDLELPRLKRLALVTGWFGEPRVEELAAMRVPALERLELWVSGDPRDRVGPRRLRELFEGGRFAKVRHLALRNSPYANELASSLPAWPIAARLKTLDLSKGTLTDGGARALLGADQLPALEQLVIDECYVSPDAIRALEVRFPRVSSRGQRTGAPMVAFREVLGRPWRR